MEVDRATERVADGLDAWSYVVDVSDVDEVAVCVFNAGGI